MTPIGLAPPPHDTELQDSAQAEPGAEARSVFPNSSRRLLPQRFAAGLWISCAAHLLALAGLLLYVGFGPDPVPTRQPSQQTVQYVDLVLPEDLPEPPTDAPGPTPATEPEAPSSATTEPPTTPGPATQAPPSVITSQGGERTVPAQPSAEAGGASVAERLRPGFSDARLYADPEMARLRDAGPSNAQRYQEHIESRIEAMNDSLYGQSGPDTDWTVKDGSGDRWGISEEGVHLGPITIPRALVPFPAASGTNQDLEEARTERQQREEIDRQEADRERREALEERNAAARERRQQQQSGGDDPDGS